MKKGGVGLPVSWSELTMIRLFDQDLSVQSEKDDLYITMNLKEVDGTRSPGENVFYVISDFINFCLKIIEKKADKKHQKSSRTQEMKLRK